MRGSVHLDWLKPKSTDQSFLKTRISQNNCNWYNSNCNTWLLTVWVNLVFNTMANIYSKRYPSQHRRTSQTCKKLKDSSVSVKSSGFSLLKLIDWILGSRCIKMIILIYEALLKIKILTMYRFLLIDFFLSHFLSFASLLFSLLPIELDTLIGYE